MPDYDVNCAHCGDPSSPVTWRCPSCGYHLCADCTFTNIDCYLNRGEQRECPGCGAKTAGDVGVAE